MHTNNALGFAQSQPSSRPWISGAGVGSPAFASCSDETHLIEQMLCNDLISPPGSLHHLARRLRSIGDRGTQWLGVFANDLFLVTPTQRLHTDVGSVRISDPAPVGVGRDHEEVDELIIEEQPASRAAMVEDDYYRAVDALEMGAKLRMRRDDGSAFVLELVQRCPATGMLEMSDERREAVARTRSGLAAELRRGTCRLLADEELSPGMLGRVFTWLCASTD